MMTTSVLIVSVDKLSRLASSFHTVAVIIKANAIINGYSDYNDRGK